MIWLESPGSIPAGRGKQIFADSTFKKWSLHFLGLEFDLKKTVRCVSMQLIKDFEDVDYYVSIETFFLAHCLGGCV